MPKLTAIFSKLRIPEKKLTKREKKFYNHRESQKFSVHLKNKHNSINVSFISKDISLTHDFPLNSHTAVFKLGGLFDILALFSISRINL